MLKLIESSKAADAFKWFITCALLATAVVGNSLYGEMSVAIRAAAVVILIAAALGVAALTTKGKATIAFSLEKQSLRSVKLFGQLAKKPYKPHLSY